MGVAVTLNTEVAIYSRLVKYSTTLRNPLTAAAFKSTELHQAIDTRNFSVERHVVVIVPTVVCVADFTFVNTTESTIL